MKASDTGRESCQELLHHAKGERCCPGHSTVKQACVGASAFFGSYHCMVTALPLVFRRDLVAAMPLTLACSNFQTSGHNMNLDLTWKACDALRPIRKSQHYEDGAIQLASSSHSLNSYEVPGTYPTQDMNECETDNLP